MDKAGEQNYVKIDVLYYRYKVGKFPIHFDNLHSEKAFVVNRSRSHHFENVDSQLKLSSNKRRQSVQRNNSSDNELVGEKRTSHSYS